MQYKYDILFLCDAGIGNAIEAMYAVECCIKNNVKVGIYLNTINTSFQEYLRGCYGADVILKNVDGVSAKNLIHSFTYIVDFDIPFQNYFFIQPDKISSKILSETEQYLSVVRALYPSNYSAPTLSMLKEHETENIKHLQLADKYVLYPGGSSFNPARRWPHFEKLIDLLSKEKIIVIGGNDDLINDMSYCYPKWVSKLVPQVILNRKNIWTIFKQLGLLSKHAHNKFDLTQEHIQIGKLNWPELVYVMRKCKSFIGNDGGLSHLAGAAGTSGYVLFGPSSVDKNKPYNSALKPVSSKGFNCSPCQFQKAEIPLLYHMINCPYQVGCLKTISPESLIK